MERGNDLVRKEKIRLIGDILNLYFRTTPPDEGSKYWYGDRFDDLYDKDLTELYVRLSVYRKTRNKNYF